VLTINEFHIMAINLPGLLECRTALDGGSGTRGVPNCLCGSNCNN